MTENEIDKILSVELVKRGGALICEVQGNDGRFVFLRFPTGAETWVSLFTQSYDTLHLLEKLLLPTEFQEYASRLAFHYEYAPEVAVNLCLRETALNRARVLAEVLQGGERSEEK
jgi:hypothetical protein